MRAYEELLEAEVGAIDIGQSGGIAWSCDRQMHFSSFPKKEYWTPEKEFHFVDLLPNRIFAENVHTWKGQGIKSSGTLMESKGRIVGYAAATDRELIFIEPRSWIQCFTLKTIKNFKNKDHWKKHLMEIAKSYTCRQEITLNTADAVLIWAYAAHIALGFSLTKKRIFSL